MTYPDYRFSADVSSNAATLVGFTNHDVLSDNSDTSYCGFTSPPGTAWVEVLVAPVSQAANQRIARVQAKVRYSSLSQTTDFYAIIKNAAGQQVVFDHWTDLFGFLSFQWRDPTFQTFGPTGAEWQAADIHSLRLQDNGGGTGRPRITEALVEVDLRTQSACTITAPTGPQSTKTPLATWTVVDPDGQGQRSFQVRVFASSVVLGGAFNADTSVNVYDSGVQVGSSNGVNILQWQIPTPLADNNYYCFVKSSKTFNGVDWWSQWAALPFQISSAPPLPLNVTPTNGQVINTDIPFLTALDLSPLIPGTTVKTEWEIASDSGFITNLIDVVEPDSNLRTQGTASFQLSSFTPLSSGTWFIRAREVDNTGTTSPGWTAPQQFTVSHVAGATNLQPSGGNTINFGSTGNVTLSWNFYDPSPIDQQTAYQVVLSSNLDGTIILDTGKVTSAATSVVATVPAFYKNIPLRWQVLLYDSSGAPGLWSDFAMFTMGSIPTVTITNPVSGSTITNPQPTITWVYNSPDGLPQTSYRVVLSDHLGVVLQDSGPQTGFALSYTPPSPWFVPGNTYQLTLYASGSAGIVATNTSIVTATFTGGPAPTTTVDALSYYDTFGGGYVEVFWDTSVATGAFTAWRIYRRNTGTAAWTLLHTELSQSVGTYFDYMAASGVQVDYAVVQVILISGIPVESVYNPITVRPLSLNYWLINPNNPTHNIQILNVTKDDPVEMYETTYVTIPGRGRHVEYGSRLGWKGQLTAQLFDRQPNGSARTQKSYLLTAKADMTPYYLRNPFGDMWMVAFDDMTIGRIAGVGLREFCNITIPYEEIAP